MASLSPFDFIKDLSKEKKNILEDDLLSNNESYNQFVINKAFSYFPDTILHAATMNLHQELPNVFHNKYFLEAISSRNRFSKWHKPSKNENVEMVKNYYKCNIRQAREYVSILTEEQLDFIKKKTDVGGVKGKI